MNIWVARWLLMLSFGIVLSGCEPPKQTASNPAGPPLPPPPPGSAAPAPPPAPPAESAQPQLPAETKVGVFAGGIDDLAARPAAPQPVQPSSAAPAADSGTERVKAQAGVGAKGRSLDQYEGVVVTPVKTYFVVSGLDVCRRLRADAVTRDLFIVMLTAKSEESDELIGFNLGADDYITKPFSVKILLERLKALARRRMSEVDGVDVTTKLGILVDRVRHRAMADDRPLNLTRSEFRLLDTLIRQAGRVFCRSELIDSALGEDTMVLERTIDVHVRALRRKLGERADVIETVRGVGYRFRENAPEPEYV